MLGVSDDDDSKKADRQRCLNCKWWEEYTAVCCNGDSEYRADFTDKDFCCGEWERWKI